MAKPRVFICHSSSDKNFVRSLCQEIERHGVKVWLDEREITVGDSLFESIQHGLKNTDFLLAVLSPEAVVSQWVKKELATYFSLEIESKRKRILPLLIKDCEIPLFLKDKKYADFRISFDTGFDEILKVLLNNKSNFLKPFESLDSLIVLDIIDERGQIVKYKKTSTLKAMVQKPEHYVETFTTDGEMQDFSVDPGEIKETWKESGVTYIKTIFPASFNRGDAIKRTFSCTFRDGFVKDCEYWEGKQTYPAHDYKIKIIFPHGRIPTRWETYERDAADDTPSIWKADLINENDRFILFFKVSQPRLYINYIIKWWW